MYSILNLIMLRKAQTAHCIIAYIYLQSQLLGSVLVYDFWTPAPHFPFLSILYKIPYFSAK